MRVILSILYFVCFCLVACSSDDQQNGTNQNAPNTLESLINPNAGTTTSTTPPAITTASNSIGDIWVLATINSEQKYNVNLVNNTPVLDLDSAKNTVSGHTGCNSLSGKLRVQGEKLLFDNVRLTSNQACNDNGFEKKLLSSFKGGNTTYRLANDSLYLNIGGAQLVYRRIRR